MGPQSLLCRGFANCVFPNLKTKRCQRVVVEQPQERAPTAVETLTRATARVVVAVVVVVVSPRGTATPMPMGLPTTTMGQAMASTILHLVERSLLAARPTPPTTTTTLGQLPPRTNSQFDLIDQKSIGTASSKTK